MHIFPPLLSARCFAWGDNQALLVKHALAWAQYYPASALKLPLVVGLQGDVQQCKKLHLIPSGAPWGFALFLLENLEQFTASVLFFSICNIIFHATQFQKKKWPKRAERGQKRPKGWKWAIVGKNESQPFARSQSALHSNCILANNKRNTEAEHCFCLCPKILSLCPKSYVGLALINNKKIKLPASLELLGDSLPQMCPFMRIEPNWAEFWIAVPLTFVTDLRWVLPFCFCFHQVFFFVSFHFISVIVQNCLNGTFGVLFQMLMTQELSINATFAPPPN